MSPWLDSQTCEGIQHDLEAYLDGSLAVLRVQQIEGHLTDCQACLAQLHLAKEIQNELRALPEFDAAAAVIHSIYDQTVRVEESKGPLRRLLGDWARPAWTVLAAAALALAIGSTLLNQSTAPAPDRPDEAAIAQATAEARFALAQVGLATRKAGFAVRDKALREPIVIPTQEALSRALERYPAPDSASIDKGVNDV